VGSTWPVAVSGVKDGSEPPLSADSDCATVTVATSPRHAIRSRSRCSRFRRVVLQIETRGPAAWSGRVHLRANSASRNVFSYFRRAARPASCITTADLLSHSAQGGFKGHSRGSVSIPLPSHPAPHAAQRLGRVCLIFVMSDSLVRSTILVDSCPSHQVVQERGRNLLRRETTVTGSAVAIPLDRTRHIDRATDSHIGALTARTHDAVRRVVVATGQTRIDHARRGFDFSTKLRGKWFSHARPPLSIQLGTSTSRRATVTS